jgi:hypothetical protein
MNAARLHDDLDGSGEDDELNRANGTGGRGAKGEVGIGVGGAWTGNGTGAVKRCGEGGVRNHGIAGAHLTFLIVVGIWML